MSGQGVQTHHRMAVEVNDPNKSGQDMLSSGCDVHERRMSSWEIRMELIRIALRTLCHLGEGFLHLAHADAPPCAAQLSLPGEEFRALTFLHPDISQPDGRGGRFNFSGQTYPDFLITLTCKVFSLSIQCCGVLLKLPDIFDRHLEIFCFRYLMSKSPNSLCNSPIIGFLSL